MYVSYTGERIRLRPFHSAAEARRIYVERLRDTHPHWGPIHLPGTRFERMFDNGGFFDPGSYSSFAVERLDSGELIGYEGYDEIEPGTAYSAVGTFIMPDHQRRGFGVEAKQLCFCHVFENFPVEVILGDTPMSHRAARRGMELSGMRYVGRQQGLFNANGKYMDLAHYAITRREWQQLPIRRRVQRGQ